MHPNKSFQTDAHRVILASQSTFFRKLLADRPLNSKSWVNIELILGIIGRYLTHLRVKLIWKLKWRHLIQQKSFQTCFVTYTEVSLLQEWNFTVETFGSKVAIFCEVGRVFPAPNLSTKSSRRRFVRWWEM